MVKCLCTCAYVCMCVCVFVHLCVYVCVFVRVRTWVSGIGRNEALLVIWQVTLNDSTLSFHSRQDLSGRQGRLGPDFTKDCQLLQHQFTEPAPIRSCLIEKPATNGSDVLDGCIAKLFIAAQQLGDDDAEGQTFIKSSLKILTSTLENGIAWHYITITTSTTTAVPII